ncbi:RNA polymerase sigma factor [Arthrobacter oryzae]|uniref:RNA polymerase sigma factor n=1 Tax=Arthrobacter oryzae TaxID=409290 RepID=UPI00273B65D2|nr:RNA polymerase sigma factor [Arthrobacter oryzae]WLQ07147.1 RNA polymerase sigma factor [Arthrobacter oryzae]
MHGAPAQAVLAAKASCGSTGAFEVLAANHRRMILAVCLRITGNPDDAEDAAQDALLAAWLGIGSFRGEAALGTWLYRIATNAALGVVHRRNATSVLPEDLRAAGDFAEKQASADLVIRALGSIPEDFRVSLALRELCDFTYAQIAEHQGVCISTVKSRISRAKKALKASLPAP